VSGTDDPHPWVGPLLANLLLGIAAVLLVLFGTEVLGVYGWGLFVIGPLVLGFLAAVMDRRSTVHGATQGMYAGAIALGFASFLLLLSIIEGLICILMALPFVMLLAMLGGAIGGYLRDRTRGDDRRVKACALLAIPLAMLVEGQAPQFESDQAVFSQFDVQASPERVWEVLTGTHDLPPPDDWVLRAGIAHPLRYDIRGRGVGAERWVELSTGRTRQKVVVWEPYRRLGFVSDRTPPSMIERNPLGEVRPAHLEGYVRSTYGEIALTPLPDGTTRMVATSRYVVAMYPAFYWSRWSDLGMSRMQRHVLRSIAREAESGGGAAR
jgi:hypothetical protein